MNHLSDANLFEHLSAWADGDLSAAQVVELQQFLQSHPSAWAEFDRGAKLTRAARRAVMATTPEVSDALRKRMTSLAAIEPNAPRRVLGTSVFVRYAWAAAAIAGVTIGLIAGEFSRRSPVLAVATPSQTGDVIPASLVVHAGRAHADCSRLADRLHAAGYPKNAGALADEVERDLHSTHPYPDLSAIGFRYVGAGPCGNPLSGTVHLLYKSNRPGSTAAVSVFVQLNVGQFPLAPDRTYTVSDDRDPFPMIAWRTKDVVYFLLSDNDAMERSALAAIASVQSAR